MPVTWTYFTESLMKSATILGGSCSISSLDCISLDLHNSESGFKSGAINYCFLP